MMMPAPKRFDPRPAVAELEYDRTDMLRELYPGLHLVWDELDELRAETDSRVKQLEGVLDTVSKRIANIHKRLDDEELDEILSMIEDAS